MLSNRSNLLLCQVLMFNTSPISRKCDITVRTCKLLRHIIPLEEIDRNCLQLSYALFFGLIHISLTFSERDVGTALSYRDKNHFGASISRKTNFKSSIWKWQRRHFRKLLEVARFSLRDVCSLIEHVAGDCRHVKNDLSGTIHSAGYKFCTAAALQPVSKRSQQ